jgi:hypothetical protein
LFPIVEDGVESHLLLQPGRLLIAPNRPDDLQALGLGNLPHELADRPCCAADKERLPAPRLPNLVQRCPYGQSRHAQCAKEVRKFQAIGVVQSAEGGQVAPATHVASRHASELGYRDVGEREIADAEARAVRDEHANHGILGYGLAEVVGYAGGALGCCMQFCADVRVKRHKEDLDNVAAGWWGGQIDGAVFHTQVHAFPNRAGRGRLKDEGEITHRGRSVANPDFVWL